MKDSLTELIVICTVAGKWGKLIYQPCDLIPVHHSQSQKFATVVSKYMIVNGQNPNIEVHELRDAAVFLHQDIF